MDQIGVEEANGVLEVPNLRATLKDLIIKVLQLALRLEERGGAERDLLHEVELHHIEVVRQLLLQREVLGDVGERARGAERGAVLQPEVLLEVERRDLAEARDERLAEAATAAAAAIGGCGLGDVVDLPGGVVADVLEAVVGVGDGGEVGEEVGSGDLGGGLGGGDGGEFGRRDGGGGGPPADPGGGVGGVGVVEDRGEALDGVGI